MGNVVCGSSGPKDSFPLTHSIFAKFISFSFRDPTGGYLATAKKLESSDRPQWKSFNPIKGFRGVFGETVFISQGTSQHCNSCLEPVNPWEDSAQRAVVSLPQHRHNTHEQEQDFSWPWSVQPRFNLPGYWPGIRCQLHSLWWQPVFFC